VAQVVDQAKSALASVAKQGGAPREDSDDLIGMQKLTKLINGIHRAYTLAALIQINDPLTRARQFPGDPLPECSMDFEPSDLIVGLLMAALGLIGLILASGAMDSEMYVFGLSLFGFACVFDFGLLRRHFDRLEANRHG
jgi:hypothetical protein